MILSSLSVSNLNQISLLINFLENFSEKSFGIVSRKSDTDDSYYMVGTMVRVID